MIIATYNVNGVNGRLPVLLRWLKEQQPDMVCLQELKAPDERFPQQALAEAAANGVAIVRASRAGSGHVMHNGAAKDDALGFVSAGTLNPYKARVLLALALAGGIDDRRELQRVFDTY